jgi:NAD(P)-dependent dehydrogenase (short-subunit alcohol dehydrogenase family)
VRASQSFFEASLKVLRTISQIIAKHGRIDVLHANAGATKFASVENTTAQEWRWVLQHELDIVFLPVMHAWPRKERCSGFE